VEVPEIEYTRSGDVAIAYQTFGAGPHNVVVAPMFSNFDRGVHELKGVPGQWRLYAVDTA